MTRNAIAVARIAASHHVVDLRFLPASAGRSAALIAFDQLTAGEVLDVHSADDHRGLLHQLQWERPGQFEWTPAADEPGCFHVEITRRDVPRGSLRTVTEALSWDHHRLADLERRAFAALRAGDLRAAADRYRAFVRGLNRHIRSEEELLFPLFEHETGGSGPASPASALRAEHREIRMLLEDIERNVDGTEVVAERRESLLAIQREHDEKEEALLYPAIDRALSPTGSDALVARIQEMPA